MDINMDHELLPDDDERLSRLEAFQDQLNRILKGDKTSGKKGILDDVKEMKDNVSNITESMKTIKIAIIAGAVGLIIALVIAGIIKWQEALGIIK